MQNYVKLNLKSLFVKSYGKRKTYKHNIYKYILKVNAKNSLNNLYKVSTLRY